MRSNPWVCVGLVALCVVASSAHGQAPAEAAAAGAGTEPSGVPLKPDTDARLSTWLTYAYAVADAADAPEAMRRATSAPGYTAERAWPLALVLANLPRASGEDLDAWADAAAEGPAALRHVLSTAIWWRGDAGGRRLNAIADRVSAGDPRDAVKLRRAGRQPPVPLHEWPLSAETLDLWWAAYFGSGDPRWVDLVLDGTTTAWIRVDLLDGREPQSEAEKADATVAASGTWSLASNAYQHPRVLAHLRARRASFSGAWPVIDEAIAAAERRLGEEPSPAPPAAAVPAGEE